MREGGGVINPVRKDTVCSGEDTLDTDCEIAWTKIQLKGCKALHKNQRLSKKNGTKSEIKKTTKTRERMCPRWVSRSSSINGISCVTLVKNSAESHELGEAGIV
jgi:hypothetical protein